MGGQLTSDYPGNMHAAQILCVSESGEENELLETIDPLPRTSDDNISDEILSLGCNLSAEGVKDCKGQGLLVSEDDELVDGDLNLLPRKDPVKWMEDQVKQLGDVLHDTGIDSMDGSGLSIKEVVSVQEEELPNWKWYGSSPRSKDIDWNEDFDKDGDHFETPWLEESPLTEPVERNDSNVHIKESCKRIVLKKIVALSSESEQSDIDDPPNASGNDDDVPSTSVSALDALAAIVQDVIKPA